MRRLARSEDPAATSKPPRHGRTAKSVAADVPPLPLPRADALPLGELLVARRSVDPTQVAEALVQQAASGKRVGALLVELGALDEADLAEVLAEHFGLALVDLRTETPEADCVAERETHHRPEKHYPQGQMQEVHEEISNHRE